MAAVLSMSWKDPRLTWNEVQYANLTEIQMPTNSIWMPTIGLFNGVAETLYLVVDGQTSASVTSNGIVNVFISKTFRATCKMDLTYFPFDAQNCTMTFQNGELRLSTLGAIFVIVQDKVIKDVFDDGGEFELLDSSLKNFSYCFWTIEACFSSFNVSMLFSRRSSYYLMSFVIPSVCLTGEKP